MNLEYKIVETMVVTDDVIEDLINEWIGKGWDFEYVQFVMRDASKRPSMAFIFFSRTQEDSISIASTRAKGAN